MSQASGPLSNAFIPAGHYLVPSDSAIVSFTADERAGERLRAAGVRSSVRAGRVRVSPHLYTGAAHIDRALEALAGYAAG